ncbi:DUF2304 domain-containing protein [Ferroacidibacillus organovorans]|uniref:DUF2304 domain-containing protein n=1 Tax=Ferroacidibacillus organovorans TaxID=1765683 RepID=A0A162U5S9_9BACL|nr:DUF2304 domain-containing protein [Ferroacidibacillus organovorans]KYP81423.1 hypothetical protein AYJ22_01275 [Ferroacidibacillus organovorans]OAG95210.1 hypothetical protein AYW79_01875 [Ferroacidibacillus organovorans]OPG15202.1 hypothetical protein B2M26_13730 [Ferroacidibacillus organovorans]
MIIDLVGFLVSLIFLIVVIDLMRRRLLLEQYALFWLGMGIVLTILSVSPGLLNRVAKVLGIYYAPSLLFLVGFLFMLGTMLHLTVVLSRLTNRTVRLTQELGMLKSQLEMADHRTALTERSEPLSNG